MSSSSGVCAGCRSKILNKDYLNCAFCKLRYDLSCANISEKGFNLMNAANKTKWKCPGCRAKQPKTDNSNTPLRSEERFGIEQNSPEKAGAKDMSPKVDSNITLRKKFSKAISTDYDDSSDTPITLENIRPFIQEEFTLMKTALVRELEISLQQMVRAEFQSIRDEISTLESSVRFLDENYETAKTALIKCQESLKQVQKDNMILSNTVYELNTRLQAMEQHNRANNLEIQCVPEHKNENLISTIMQISKVVSANLKETDIHHCTRVAKLNREDKRPRSIIVKLGTPLLRDTFLANTIKFNKEHQNDKLNTSHIGIAGDKKPIYILEHLSPQNKKLHAAARQFAKKEDYKFVWIKQGKVFIRKTESSQFVYVRNQEVLDKLHLAN